MILNGNKNMRKEMRQHEIDLQLLEDLGNKRIYDTENLPQWDMGELSLCLFLTIILTPNSSCSLYEPLTLKHAFSN